MIEIQFTLQELGFLMECTKAMVIKGSDAPFVTNVMSKMQAGATKIKELEEEAKSTSKSKSK